MGARTAIEAFVSGKRLSWRGSQEEAGNRGLVTDSKGQILSRDHWTEGIHFQKRGFFPLERGKIDRKGHRGQRPSIPTLQGISSGGVLKGGPEFLGQGYLLANRHEHAGRSYLRVPLGNIVAAASVMILYS